MAGLYAIPSPASRCGRVLCPKRQRRLRVTTDSKHGLPSALNLLDRQFDVAQSDRVQIGDNICNESNESKLFYTNSGDQYALVRCNKTWLHPTLDYASQMQFV